MIAKSLATGYSREELDRFEALLLERRTMLLDDLRALEAAEARDGSSPSASSHLADFGSDRASSDVSLGRLESESDEVQQIDDALERIRQGTYGLCETCDEKIAAARLEAIPYAALCLPCKRREER